MAYNNFDDNDTDYRILKLQQKIESQKQMIKELYETFNLVESYIPKKFYGQGESIPNKDYSKFKTTLEKAKQHL